MRTYETVVVSSTVVGNHAYFIDCMNKPLFEGSTLDFFLSLQLIYLEVHIKK